MKTNRLGTVALAGVSGRTGVAILAQHAHYGCRSDKCGSNSHIISQQKSNGHRGRQRRGRPIFDRHSGG